MTLLIFKRAKVFINVFEIHEQYLQARTQRVGGGGEGSKGSDPHFLRDKGSLSNVAQ